MKLPNVEHAVIDERKVRDYLLSEAHPVGRFKAAFFRGLGFDPERLPELEKGLRDVASLGEVGEQQKSPFGEKYVVAGVLQGPGGASAEVVTVWILLTGDDKPRLITVYPR